MKEYLNSEDTIKNAINEINSVGRETKEEMQESIVLLVKDRVAGKQEISKYKYY